MINAVGRRRGFSRGAGGGMGFGFRGGYSQWPYVGRGRGGLPRCGYYFGGAGAPAHSYMPYTPQLSKDDELNFMKDQAEAIKRQLEQIESRMRTLETEK
jgi:hypothetical protein